MIKAIFFDIDGTLVSIKSHKIPQSTVDALDRARKNGVQIFISTGRPPALMNNLGQLQERGLIDGYITMNGCYCFVGDEVIYRDIIPSDEVRRMVRLCREEGYSCLFVGEDRARIFQSDRIFEDTFYKDLDVAPIPSADFKDIPDYEIFQLTPFFTKEVEDRIAPEMTGCEFGRWHPAFVDINAKGNTKSKGMDQIIRHFGLDLSETMAFGDGGNDITMLSHAGTGVAMGNAEDDVKSYADYVTLTVDDGGVAAALRHFNII